MKVLRSATAIMRSASGKILKIRPDSYVDPLPNVFMVEVAVEEGQTITLPTPLIAASYLNLYMTLYNSGNTILRTNDNSGGNSQPLITQVCTANTEYYIKITGTTNNIEGYFGIQVTGPGTDVPDTESGITSLIVGVPITEEYLPYGGEKWYKFKTGAAGSYVMRTNLGEPTEYSYNYDVDWSDNSPITTGITIYNSTLATHTYNVAGSYVIYITGRMPGWSVNNNSNMKLLITKCISWGDVGLIKIDFYGCSAMTNLPDQQGKLANVRTFANFCNGCTSLVSIPYGTFFGDSVTPVPLSVSFASSFNNCTSLRSVHSDLFRDNVENLSFSFTFNLCTKLEILPSQLFRSCYKVTTWDNCFAGCVVLNNLPVDLFYRTIQETNYAIIAKSSFYLCFAGCSGLSGVTSGFFSSPQPDNSGLNVVKGTNFSGCFAYCSVLKNLPDYLFHNQIYATTFAGVFSHCITLLSLPTSCFEGCNIATTFGSQSYVTIAGVSKYIYGVAGYCTLLTTINPNCFKECFGATDFTYGFTSDTSLVTLCADIFDDCTEISSLYGTFSNCRISSEIGGTPYQLDPDIFQYNTKIGNFTSTFSSNPNLKDLPEQLFSACVSATTQTFSNCFTSCVNLRDLPPKLFRYNINATSFQNTFSSCTNVTKIPIITEGGVDYGFFYFNPRVSTFYATFSSCRLANTYEPSFVPAIPAITFLNNTEVTSFYTTFGNNPTLESTSTYPIPEILFSGCRSVTDFSYLFQGCTNVNFNYIPAGLFTYNTNVNSFRYAFGSTKLATIPDTLFDTCSRATDFGYTFSGTPITRIPNNLFYGPRGSAQDYSYTFQSCTLLTIIDVDDNIFPENINVQSFYATFSNCTSLTAVNNPNLFKDCVLATNFTSTFGSCTSLITVPQDLFKYNISATVFNSTFSSCNKLVQNRNIFYSDGEQSTRFINKVMNFQSCFTRTSSGTTQGEAPDLWDCTYSYTPTKTNCWSGAGNSVSSLSNYVSIPIAWKT